MGRYRVLVEVADGNDFSAPRQFSEIEVEADDDRQARLIAEQMSSTPHRGKPDHLQITHSEIVDVIE